MVVRWHKTGDVVSECTLHNFIVFAIFVQKIIKVGFNFTKLWQKTILTVYLDVQYHYITFWNKNKNKRFWLFGIACISWYVLFAATVQFIVMQVTYTIWRRSNGPPFCLVTCSLVHTIARLIAMQGPNSRRRASTCCVWTCCTTNSTQV